MLVWKSPKEYFAFLIAFFILKIKMSYLYLYIYDISNSFKCIWHTSIVAYNLEYYFGIDGIQVFQPVLEFLY